MKHWTIAAAMALLTSAAFAQDVDSLESFWTWYGEKSAEIENFKGDMEQAITLGPMSMSFNGSMMGDQDSQRIEMSMSMGAMTQEMLMVMNDGAIWTEVDMGGQKMVMKAEAPENPTDLSPGGPGGGTDFLSDIDDLKAVEGVSFGGPGDVNGTPVYFLDLPISEEARNAMKQGNPMAGQFPVVVKTRMALSQEDAFARQISVLIEDGSPMVEITLTNVELNTELPEDAFRYEPPEGVQVMDLTKMTQGLGGAPPAAVPAE